MLLGEYFVEKRQLSETTYFVNVDLVSKYDMLRVKPELIPESVLKVDLSRPVILMTMTLVEQGISKPKCIHFFLHNYT